MARYTCTCYVFRRIIAATKRARKFRVCSQIETFLLFALITYFTIMLCTEYTCFRDPPIRYRLFFHATCLFDTNVLMQLRYVRVTNRISHVATSLPFTSCGARASRSSSYSAWRSSPRRAPSSTRPLLRRRRRSARGARVDTRPYVADCIFHATCLFVTSILM